MPDHSPPTSSSTDNSAAQREYQQAFSNFQSLLGSLDLSQLPPDNPATVYTTLVTTWMLVYQRLHAGCSLTQAVHDLLQQSVVPLPDNRRVGEGTLSSNTGAYSRAQQRLRPEVTDDLADQAFRLLIAQAPPTLGDRRVMLLDGTTIKLAPTKALQAAFPPISNQGKSVWPVAQLLVAHEFASGCAVRPEIGPMYGDAGVSELELTRRILPRLPAHSVLLADRSFGIFAVAYAATQAGHDVVFRLKEDRFRALCRSAELVEQTSTTSRWQLTWRPSAKERSKHSQLPPDAQVHVWLHELRVSAEQTLWLVTTVPLETMVLTELYRRRVDVETDIRDIKVTLKFEAFRTKSVAMIRKELATSIIAYNLVVQARRLAAQIARVPPRRLSFTGVLIAVRGLLERSIGTADEQWQRFELALKLAAQHKLPNRPGRSYPRTQHTQFSKSLMRKKPPPKSK